MIKDFNWVHDHLICEFHHYDCCLIGLVKDIDTYLLAEVIDPKPIDGPITYNIYEIKWDNECAEFLADYEIAFAYWFWDLSKFKKFDDNLENHVWFTKKWKDREPIIEKSIRSTGPIIS
jgi:hypothetical protein